MASNPSKRAAIYTRISQKNKKIPKVERQEELCRELARTHGYEISKVYVDDGISAYGFKDRPDWDQLRLDLVAGKFSVLIAQSEDRFTRQPMEKEMLMLACSEAGVVFHTVQEGITDPATADGELMASLRGMLGRWFVSKGKANQLIANDKNRTDGGASFGGVRPFGYSKDKLRLHPVEKKLIREAYTEILAERETLSSVAREWNKKGHLGHNKKPWTHTKVRQLLLRPRNAGFVVHRGEILPDIRGEWKPLVTEEVWQEMASRMQQRSQQLGKTVQPKWLCSSLAKCPCGAPMRLATRNGDELSYRCATAETGMTGGTRHTSIGAAILDKIATASVVEAVLFAPRNSVSDRDVETLTQLRDELNKVRRADLALLDLVERKDYTPADISTRSTTYKNRALQLEAQITAIERDNASAGLLSEAQSSLWSGNTVSFAEAAVVKHTIEQRFEALPLTQKRALIKGMLEMTVHPGRGPKRVEVRHLVAVGLNEQSAQDR